MPCHLQMAAPSSVATLPAFKLRSPPVCNILTQDLIQPVVENNWNVAAFRMHWPRIDGSIQTLWDRIVPIRAELDELVKTIPGPLFIVSGIYATASYSKTGPNAVCRVLPGVGYWVVTKGPSLDSRSLCDHMNNNRCGATMKLVLQPYQTAEKDFRQALFNTVKDNVEGCVRRLVEDSRVYCYGPTERLGEPVVKIYVTKEGPRNRLSRVVRDLAAVRFRADLIELDS